MLPTAHISCFPEKFNVLAIFTYGFLLSGRRSRERCRRTVPSRRQGPGALPVPHTVPLQSCLWVSPSWPSPKGPSPTRCFSPLPTPGHTPLVASAPRACLLKQVSPELPASAWHPGSHRSPCPGTASKLSQGPAPPQWTSLGAGIWNWPTGFPPGT